MKKQYRHKILLGTADKECATETCLSVWHRVSTQQKKKKKKDVLQKTKKRSTNDLNLCVKMPNFIALIKIITVK